MAIWGIDALTGNVCGHVMAGMRNDVSFTDDWVSYEYDGSLIAYYSARRDPSFANIVIPTTISGLIVYWSPLVAMLGVGLSAPVIALLPTLGRPLRVRIRIPRARLTLFRMMVVIGTASAWLWLGRFDPYTRIAGTVTFALMLYSGFRRSLLAKEYNTEGTPVTGVSRAVIAGYLFAILLALAWVISILVWDSYQAR
jgi:hypothetical protein